MQAWFFANASIPFVYLDSFKYNSRVGEDGTPVHSIFSSNLVVNKNIQRIIKPYPHDSHRPLLESIVSETSVSVAAAATIVCNLPKLNLIRLMNIELPNNQAVTMDSYIFIVWLGICTTIHNAQLYLARVTIHSFKGQSIKQLKVHTVTVYPTKRCTN